MPKVFIELHDGLISNIYSSASVEVFVVMNPSDKDSGDTNPQKWPTESLELIEVFEEPAVLVAGNLSDGFTFIGPFDTFDDAVAVLPRDTDTWVATLELPPSTAEPVAKPPTIPARIVTDNRVMDVTFDALAWFKQADDDDILALQRCEYGGDYPADEVAYFAGKRDPLVKGVVSYLKDQNRGPEGTIGFEVYVDQAEAEKWLLENRPHLMQEEQV